MKGLKMQEAVLIEDGKEIYWIDPVISIEEDHKEWIVDNGSHTHFLKKRDNRELIIREKYPKW